MAKIDRKNDKSDRKTIGYSNGDVLIPIAPSVEEASYDYDDMRDAIIAKIKESHVRIILQANIGVIMLYWDIGNEILRRQRNEGWGAKVIDR